MNNQNILQEQPLNDLPEFYTGHPSFPAVDDVRNKLHVTDFFRLVQVKTLSVTIPVSPDGINPGTTTTSFNHNTKGIPFPFVYSALATEKLPITGISADSNSVFFTGNNYTLSIVTISVIVYVYEFIRKT